jgi:hypothetical protein
LIQGDLSRANDDNFTAAQLLDALLEIIAVEEGLVFEAVPYVLKQVSVEAVGAYRAEDMADLVHAGDVEKQPRRSLPRRQELRHEWVVGNPVNEGSDRHAQESAAW